MTKSRHVLTDGITTVVILLSAFGANLLLRHLYQTEAMIPTIFVLGVFLISRWTQGYFWGIFSSLVSVLCVNWGFTYPYWGLDLISPECISSAVSMLLVAIITGTLTTRLKQQEKLRADAEKERMRGNLLRAISHDLRTPLTGIYGACSAMIDNYGNLPEETHLKLLQDVRTDAQWLNRMVENLLSVTRMDGGKVHLVKNSTVLEELIDSLLVKFHKHYPSQKVTVQIPEDFVSIPMDPVLIEQVLMNLLENAFFHAKGMTHLWLTVVRKNNKAVFSVEDDGCGISEERLPHLFTGLLSSEAPVDSHRSNMGIGLSVCNAIVKAHGAEMHAGNRPEGGAVFSFALEMEETDHVE